MIRDLKRFSDLKAGLSFVLAKNISERYRLEIYVKLVTDIEVRGAGSSVRKINAISPTRGVCTSVNENELIVEIV